MKDKGICVDLFQNLADYHGVKKVTWNIEWNSFVFCLHQNISESNAPEVEKSKNICQQF